MAVRHLSGMIVAAPVMCLLINTIEGDDYRS